MELQNFTEIKFENSINRVTAVANPRQIERVIRGAEFDLNIIYEVEKEEELIEDIEVIAEGIRLLQYDYIGGNGSRGYGKIKFNDIHADTVIGELDGETEDKINDMLTAAI